MLLFYMMTGVTQGYCQDFFMGKVLSFNTIEKEIEVAPQSSNNTKLEPALKGEKVLVHSKIALPACVTTGADIRLWGEVLQGETNTFIATDIRGCRGGGCSDPTGVRSRLSRRGKHARSSWNDSDSTDKSMESNGRGNGGHGGNGGSGNGNGGAGNGGDGGGGR